MTMQRISEITDLQLRQRWLDYLGRPDYHEQAPVKVLYYGHSFVQHLQDYFASLPTYMFNFGLDTREACIYYKSLSGATIDRLRKKSNVDKVNKMQAEIVILECGTNDLADVDLSAGDVCDKMMNLCRDVLDCRVREVIVSQVLLRGEAGLRNYDPDYTEKVYLYNHMVENALQYLPRASFWHHHNLWRDIEDHVVDGTHLNDLGNKKLYRSLKGALNTAITRVRPAWATRGQFS